MPPFLAFIITNWYAIEAALELVSKAFPSKTVVGQVGTQIALHPDASTALQKVVSDYANVNK